MLWALGSKIIHERKVGQALFNCAFVSTDNMHVSLDEAIKPFTFMMDMSMVGVGVGFDVEGAKKVMIHKPSTKATVEFIIPDTREGWVESLEILLKDYFSDPRIVSTKFNYSKIRPAGVPIAGFGGISSGPAPLQKNA